LKILIVPDKFKGSLTAKEVCAAIEEGLTQDGDTHTIIKHPMADGGDGTLEIISKHLNLKRRTIETTGPLGNMLFAPYFFSEDTAFIEFAHASGLNILEEKERNPLKTTSFGTGKIIAQALSEGFKKIYLFIGGSATTDAGIGIAEALGFKFLDSKNNVLEPVGGQLKNIDHIEPSSMFDFKKTEMNLVCDVSNPLFGPDGAAYVYAPQKGASQDQVVELDNGLRKISNVIEQQFDISISNIPGTGAAGGIAASMIPLCGAKIAWGFETISKLTGLEQKIKDADWVISGEGKLDVQSLQGKVIDGVSKLCKKYKKPLSLFVGQNELSESDAQALGTKHILMIDDHTDDMEDAMQNGKQYLVKMATEINGSLTQ